MFKHVLATNSMEGITQKLLESTKSKIAQNSSENLVKEQLGRIEKERIQTQNKDVLHESKYLQGEETTQHPPTHRKIESRLSPSPLLS